MKVMSWPISTGSTANSLIKDRTLRSDLVVVGLLQVGSVLGSMLSTAILARSLGVAGKGVVDYYLLMVFLGTDLGSLGFSSGILYITTRDRVRPAVAMGTSVALASLLGLLAAVAMLVYTASAPPEYVLAIAIAAATCPFAIFRVLWSSIATAANDAPLIYLLQFVGTVIPLTSLAGLWAIGWLTPASAAACLLSATALIAILAGSLYVKRFGIQWDGPSSLRAWQQSRKIFPGHAVNTLTFRADQYVLAYLTGPAGLGIYALSARLAEMFWLLDGVLISASLYRITTLPRRESWELTRKLLMGVLMVGGCSVGLGFFLAEPLIVLVFGEAFRDSYPVFMILLVASISWSLARVSTQYLGFRLGHLGDCTRGAIVGAVVTVIGLGYLVFVAESRSLLLIASVSLITYTTTAASYFLFIVLAHRQKGLALREN